MKELKENPNIYDILVVGGGPSGIMVALTAKKLSCSLSIGMLDSKASLASKLKITGGGRCNFTNDEYIGDFFDKVVTNEKFLYSAFYTFTNEDLKEFVKSLGLEYIVEKDNENKVYIGSGRSIDFVDALVNRLIDLGIDIFYNKKIVDIEKIPANDVKKERFSKGIRGENTDSPECILQDDEVLKEGEGIYYKLTSHKGQVFYAKSIVLATEGLSFKNTGSDGSMLGILSRMGYEIIKPRPALVPINLKDTWFKSMAGISFKDAMLDVDIDKTSNKNNRKYNQNYTDINGYLTNNKKVEQRAIYGDIIITHKGIGGPASLKMSSLINKICEQKNVVLKLDLLPQESSQSIYEYFISNPTFTLPMLLKKYLPKRYIGVIIDELMSGVSSSNFDFRTDKVANLSKKNFEHILSYIKNISLSVDSIMDIDCATVTAGGISVRQVNPSTMESKKDENLYFVGEMLDVDAFTGGYNLQIAFSTGYLAGDSVVDKLQD